MKNPYVNISANIISIFIVAIVVSFVPEYLHPYFGDVYCQGWIEGKEKLCYRESWYHLSEWHWGYRHWLWSIMGICLSIVQIVRLIVLIKKEAE